MKNAMLVASRALTLLAQTIHVREVPPESIPHRSCKQGHSGYLGVEGNDSEKSRFTLSQQEIGEHVVKQLAQGYSLSLYPQASGRIFSIATCEATASRSQ